MLLLNTYGGLFLSTVVLLSACATTSTQKYYSTGNATLCDDADKTLGYVAVLPEAAWRKDQKEHDMRQAMALEEIENAFYDLPCGMFSPPGGLRALSNWSQQSEMDLIKAFSEEGVDSIIIIIRLEELTPRFFFTFSLPILWGGASEVDFHIRALSTDKGVVLDDMRIKRATGGPFNIRAAEWSRDELKAALDMAIGLEGSPISRP